MSKYDKLDALILNKIGNHPQKFNAIHVRDVAEECRRLATENGADLGDAFRCCDRRLQALRRAGKIRSTTKGWIRVGSPQ